MKIRRALLGLTTFIVGSFAASLANAAEIEVVGFDPNGTFLGVPTTRVSDQNFGRPFIRISGEFVPGDEVRLREAAKLLSQMQVPLVFALESPGGSVSEALAIARFVRESWGTTWIHGRTAHENDSDRSLITCDSACAIVFFAGIERRYGPANYRHYKVEDPYFIPSNRQLKSAGFLQDTLNQLMQEQGRSPIKTEVIPVLGLHRPYFDRTYNSSLPATAAEEQYIALERSVSAALTEFGVPDVLISRMMRTDSDSIDRVSSDELFLLMPRIEPWFEEWRTAKCGKLSSEEMLDLFQIESAAPDQQPFSSSYRLFLTEKKALAESCKTNLLLEHQVALLEQ